MTVSELIKELMLYNPDAEVVVTSGIGWPTFNPIVATREVKIKDSAVKFPCWFEKVEEEEIGRKAVVIF